MLNASRRTVLAAALGACASPLKVEPARVTAFATESGKVALDGVDQPGNPFATAFIEALNDPTQSVDALFANVAARTLALTGAEQAPQWSPTSSAPFAAAGQRRALVLMYSSYARGLPSLPGASTDAARVSAALQRAGFAVDIALDCTRAETTSRLAAFAEASAAADTALLYCTGHGVEVAGRQYVVPLEFDLAADEPAWRAAVTPWDDIAAAPRARRLSLSIWAGCRDNPRDWS
jgi:hypothetical protein